MASPKNQITSLRGLLKGKEVSTESGGRSRGKSYTTAERKLAFDAALTTLLATEIIPKHDKQDQIEKEVITAFTEAVKAAGDSVRAPVLMMQTYRIVEKLKLSDNKTKEDFPKEKDGVRVIRDYTSIHVLFRSVLNDLGITGEAREEMFKDYSVKKEA